MPRETTLRHDGAHAQQGNRGQRRAPRHITRLVASLMDRDRGSQTRIAELLGVDRSTVAHWTVDEGGRTYSVPADALAVVCDALDTLAPLQAIADELGCEVVQRARPTAAPMHVSSGTLALLGHISRIGLEVEHASADGRIDETEADEIRAHLDALIATAQGMLARLPRRA